MNKQFSFYLPAIFILLFSSNAFSQCPKQIFPSLDGASLTLDFSPNIPPVTETTIEVNFGASDLRNGTYNVSNNNTNTWTTTPQTSGFFNGTLAGQITITGNDCNFDDGGTTTNESSEECDRWLGPCNTTDRITRLGQVGIGADGIFSGGFQLSVMARERAGIFVFSDQYPGIYVNHGSSTTGLEIHSGFGGRAAFLNGDVSITKTLNVDKKIITPRAEISDFLYAKEIHVKLPPFPDYVFHQEYELMPINTLDEYIKKNGHLPNMPTAKDVEINGIGVGVLQIKQMEKIEELILYILQLNQRLEELEKENTALKVLPTNSQNKAK